MAAHGCMGLQADDIAAPARGAEGAGRAGQTRAAGNHRAA